MTRREQVEKKSEKVAADNFELTLDNDGMKKKLKLSQENVRKVERELGQVQVEKEWLISQQKSSAGTSEKVGEIAMELEMVKVELEHLMNEEATDINEMLKVISNIQTCFVEECGDLMSRSRMTMTGSSPSLSRSGSTSSLASSMSCAPVQDVRALTQNFQGLLARATAEKSGMEREQEKLLTVNVELAMETKRLLERQKEWKEQEEGLVRANEEFVAEVERLYREEERWEEETLRLGQEREDLAVRLSREVEEAREQTETSRTQHVEEKKLLVDSVRVLSADNARLLEEREREKQLSSKSQTELQQEFQGEVTRLQATVSSLQTELELQAREEAESEVEKVSAELERMEEQVKEVKREQVRSGMETKVEQFRQRWNEEDKGGAGEGDGGSSPRSR
jgi:hypothetical protein